MTWTKKQVNHVLGNIPMVMKGMAAEIDRLSGLSCKYCRYDAYESLQHIKKDLLRHGGDLDALRKHWEIWRNDV
jgi:hypothetical protein